MIAARRSATIHGYGAVPLLVECEAGPGLPAFAVVGLPDGAVRESRDRILSALRHSGYRLPPRKITANLAPGDIRKEGTAFDLPLALAVLEACEQIVVVPAQADRVFLGELGLDGRVRAVRGAFALAMGLREKGFRKLVVPEENRAEIEEIPDLDVVGVSHLRTAVELLETGERPASSPSPGRIRRSESYPDLSDVRGQEEAKEAMIVAAAGGHNILLTGSPGAGKTLLARRVPGILPALTKEQSLELTRVHSLAGVHRAGDGLIPDAPFRSPHHSASLVSIVGGGTSPRPGEISLALHGVLFLDELAEFPRHVLEALRQPMEDGDVAVCRARQSVRFPARFLLVGAANPCPCGFLGDLRRPCTCTIGARERYRSRLSGPLLDRMDISLHLNPPDPATLIRSTPDTVTTAMARLRVETATRLRTIRQGDIPNARLSAGELHKHCSLETGGRTLLETAARRIPLSGRGIARILRVARTIADLDGSAVVGEGHLARALTWRSARGQEAA